MKYNKDSNIAVHKPSHSTVQILVIISGTLSVIRIFHTYQKNKSSSLSLIYRIKNNLKLLQRFFLFIVNHANKAC